jgi:hypothetical protein
MNHFVNRFLATARPGLSLGCADRRCHDPELAGRRRAWLFVAIAERLEADFELGVAERTVSLGQEFANLAQPDIRLRHEAEGFLACRQRQICRTAAFNDRDCKLCVTDDRFVDILFCREQFFGNGLRCGVALVEHYNLLN